MSFHLKSYKYSTNICKIFGLIYLLNRNIIMGSKKSGDPESGDLITGHMYLLYSHVQ